MNSESTTSENRTPSPRLPALSPGQRSLGIALLFGGLIALLAVLHLNLGGSATRLWNLDETARTIIFEIRLPRFLGALAVGGAFALSGALLQPVARNPLADPFLLGLSGGAGVGAGIAILMKLPLLVTPFAFGGAFGTAMLVLGVSGTRQMRPTTLVLSGVAISTLLSSLLALLLFCAGHDLTAVLHWLWGGLGGVSLGNALPLLAAVIGGTLLSLRYAYRLNILELDEDTARSLGVSVARERLRVILLASLLTSVSVAAAGPVGFIGLLVPHLARLLARTVDNCLVLPLSALIGAALLAAADLTAKTVVAPSELPVGILTAIIGAPCLVVLLRRMACRID